ncbi:hypothetical protein [Psychromicrobium lacuslunae]|uniref:MFS transporter n=1 Tax=Psychromicrobium lacuslunae TaxID=1618207 RepID=A0A0D4C2U9_9MICC|nr:hypothetical protein [Psychromicrobium lacuslunae]AJT42874.1 hypothetical protein UM93_04250 [Psychromicrobium lacuslunae]
MKTSRAQRPAVELVALLFGALCADLSAKSSAVALPLLALSATGSAAATGVAAGAVGLPILLSPWWAPKARQWLTTGPRLALVMLCYAACTALLPVLDLLSALSAPTLFLSGLLIGGCAALVSPGRDAMLADIGDAIGPGKAASALTWRELISRSTMIIGPGLGALAVAAGLLHQMLFIESAALLLSAALALPVRRTNRPSRSEAASGARRPGTRESAAAVKKQASPEKSQSAGQLLASFRGRPKIVRGLIIRGTACLIWFAFVLGMAIEGYRQGNPGVLYAFGVTGYGLGSVVGIPVVRALAGRLPLLKVAGSGWALNGLAWILMAWLLSPWGFGVGGLLSGFGAALGFVSVTREITNTSSGPDRRTLLAVQSVVVESGGALGLLIGGPLIALCGVGPMLFATGALLLAVAILAAALPIRPDAPAQSTQTRQTHRVSRYGA